jgi:cytochrome P450
MEAPEAPVAAPVEAESVRAVPATSIKGPRTPGFLQGVQLFASPTKFMRSCRDKFGKRFVLKIFPQADLYVLTDPVDIKEMFLAPRDVLHTGQGSAALEKYFGQTGLAWLDEKEHLNRRKQLMPSVKGGAQKRVEAAITEMAKEAVASWPRGEVVSLRPYVHKFTIEVIREVVFGKHVPSCWPELFDAIWDMLKLNDSVTTMIETHNMSPLGVRALRAIKPLGLDKFFKDRDRTDALLAQAVAERLDSGEPGDDMLAVMLNIKHEDGSPLTATELRDEIMTMFVAGTETTAGGICWALEHLTRDKAALDKLTKEIDEGVDDTYLTATVHEILRLCPPNPQIIPREVVKPVVLNGVRYEPGDQLWASGYLLHTDPDVYPNPDEFQPERFVGVKPGAYTWIPFGGGHTRCLGDRIAIIETKEVLREVLTTCELRRPDPRPEAPTSRTVTMTPKRGAKMALEPRRQPVSG